LFPHNAPQAAAGRGLEVSVFVLRFHVHELLPLSLTFLPRLAVDCMLGVGTNFSLIINKPLLKLRVCWGISYSHKIYFFNSFPGKFVID